MASKLDEFQGSMIKNMFLTHYLWKINVICHCSNHNIIPELSSLITKSENHFRPLKVPKDVPVLPALCTLEEFDSS